MRNINLLPKEPFAKQYFVPILACTIVIFLASGSILALAGYRYQADSKEKEKLLEETRSQIVQLSKERIPDPLTVEYNTFAAGIQSIKELRRAWPSIMNALTTALPNAARVTSVQVDSEGKMALQTDFAALEDVTAFVVNVQALPDVGQVTVKSISAATMNSPIKVLPPVPAIPSGQGGTASVPGPKQTVQATSQPTPNAGGETESERLLEQLNGMMTRQLSEDIHGIILTAPKITPDPQPTAAPTGALTQKDMDEAKKKLDDLKKQQAVSPTPAAAQTAAPVDSTSSDPAGSTGNELSTTSERVKLYKVSLELKLKPITPVK